MVKRSTETQKQDDDNQHGHPTRNQPDKFSQLLEDAAGAAPLDSDDHDRVENRQRLRAALVYETVRKEGIEELARPISALWWSGLTAGIAIGFSVVAETMVRAHLPDTAWRPLIENLGYSVGFLLVILGRMQLFTENTITAVLPFCANPTINGLLHTARQWSIVFIANVVGTVVFAAFLVASSVLGEANFQALLSLSREMMAHEWFRMLWGGVVAGWLIAMLVWLLPSIHQAPVLVIVIITYIIALGDFAHVIAGSVEAATLVMVGEIGVVTAIRDFLIPALIGNVLGGTLLFTILAYSQVRDEVEKD